MDDNTVLQQSEDPIVPGLEHLEVTMGSKDPEIKPLRVLRGRTSEGRILCRFTPTNEQRANIFNGCDIYLSVLTFGKQLQPVMVFTSEELDAAMTVEVMQLVP